MKRNIGTADRAIRTITALVIGFLIVNGTLNGLAAILLGIFAAVFLVTSFVSFCLLYLPFKISTAKEVKLATFD